MEGAKWCVASSPLLAAGVLLFAPAAFGQPAGYIDSSACATCHRTIYESYQKTAMGRSFYRASASMFPRRAEYFHEPSGQQFTIYERGSRILQRRHQTDSAGREINAVEMTVDFVLGSGEHARTLLHRAADGQLVELPLAWYSEDGGTWAMNPGYDRPDHMDFRRKLDRECFFCHNAYPSVADSAGARLVLAGKIPEGIDCQR